MVRSSNESCGIVDLLTYRVDIEGLEVVLAHVTDPQVPGDAHHEGAPPVDR